MTPLEAELLAALKFVDGKLADAGWAASEGGVRHRILVAIRKAEEANEKPAAPIDHSFRC